MKQKNLAMLGVAVGCGLVAAVAVAKLSAGGSRGPDTVKVLVAKKDLPVQTRLDEKELDNLIGWADVPKSLAPPDAVTDIEQVKGKSLSRTLKQGNPVSATDLGTIRLLEIPDGFEAMTVKASQVDAVGGFVKPGSRVDIMYSEKTPTGKARAAIILKYMLVLAVNMANTVDEKTGAAIPQVESVTLAVNKLQATKLFFADEKGKIKFMLTGVSSEQAAKEWNEGDVKWIEDPFDNSRPPPPPTQIAARDPPATNPGNPANPPTPEAPKLESMVVVRKSVPVNTLINADNVNEYFTTTDVKKVPEGVIKNLDDLKGFFVVKQAEPGQIVFKSLTDSRALEIKAPEPTKGPAPHEVAKIEPPKAPKLPRYEQVIQEGGRVFKVIWVEVAPTKWKRFDTEKEADDFKPEPPAAPKANESKGEETKPVVGN